MRIKLLFVLVFTVTFSVLPASATDVTEGPLKKKGESPLLKTKGTHWELTGVERNEYESCWANGNKTNAEPTSDKKKKKKKKAPGLKKAAPPKENEDDATTVTAYVLLDGELIKLCSFKK